MNVKYKLKSHAANTFWVGTPFRPMKLKCSWCDSTAFPCIPSIASMLSRIVDACSSRACEAQHYRYSSDSIEVDESKMPRLHVEPFSRSDIRFAANDWILLSHSNFPSRALICTGTCHLARRCQPTGYYVVHACNAKYVQNIIALLDTYKILDIRSVHSCPLPPS